MELTNVVTIFIIVLVCGFFIIFFMSSNISAVTESGKLLPDSNIEITGVAEITPIPPSDDGPYLYNIILPLTIEHKGKWEYGNYVEIAPLITFKGVDTIPDIGTFTMLVTDQSIDVEMRATIESNIGLIREERAPYDSQMKEHESILIETEDEGNFLVTIEDIYELMPTKVRFSVECETDKKTIELVEWRFCQEGSEYSEQYEYCERYMDMCEGSIRIALMDTAALASKRVNEVIIDAEGGKPFHPAEFVEISLWETGCSNDYDNFDELRLDCMDYFMGYASIQEVKPSA